MNQNFAFNIEEYIDPFIIGDAFNEFSENLDYLDYIGTAPFTEIVNARGNRVKSGVKGTIKNTVDTTGDIFVAYDDITSANAKLIKSVWDIFASSLKIISSSISFIISKIANIPLAINRLINFMAEMPENIAAKLSGDISLYITLQDIEAIYNQMIIHNFDTFISLSKDLSEGDLWGTLFRKKVVKGNVTMASNNNDIKICKKLAKIYDNLKNIQFKSTIIHLKDGNNKEIYFLNKQSVKFKDLGGKEFKGSYLDALKKLSTDISSRKNEIETISRDVGDKYTRTQENQTFGKLTRVDQNRIVSTIRMLSKVITIVGWMVKYTITDVNTITKKMKSVQHTAKKGK